MADAPSYLGSVGQDPPREDKMDEVRRLATELVQKKRNYESLQQSLKDLGDAIFKLEQTTLPDAMSEAGTDMIGLPDMGATVVVKNWVRANLPKDPELRLQGVAWLTEHGAGDLVKCNIGVSFSKGEHNMAGDLAETLREKYPEKDVVMQEEVHHMSLTAFVKSRLAEGETVPLDILGATVGRVAQIKERD